MENVRPKASFSLREGTIVHQREETNRERSQKNILWITKDRKHGGNLINQPTQTFQAIRQKHIVTSTKDRSLC